MASPPLTIRNLTSIPVELKLVEHLEAPKPAEELARLPGGFQTGLAALTKNVTDAVDNVTGATPSVPLVDPNAKSFAERDVDIRVESFKTKKTDVKAAIKTDAEVLRLTFEVDGQKYKIIVPDGGDESQEFKCLAPNPKHHLTGVFLPHQTYLAIFASTNLNSWMKNLKDGTPLSALSIPGTHNSPTCNRALPSVRCQSCTPTEQLDNGVRFFDLRVQPKSPDSDQLELVHGVFPISLTGPKYFRDLINEVYAFLDKNPSETVIVSLKREGTGNMTDQQLGRILFDHYTNDENKWYTKPHIPTLGEARHKVVLLRRFCLGDLLKKENGGKGFGLNAESWADNTPCNTHGAVCVQDFYEVLETENIDKKITYAEAQCERAGDCVAHIPGITTDAVHPVPPQPFYLNFLSASNFWKVGCWPEKIAAKLNPAMVEFLCTKFHLQEDKGDGGTGIMILDWVGFQGDWDLVRCIVGMNTKLELKMSGEQ